MEKLKKCPFCGGEADIYSVDDACQVMCDTCRCRTPMLKDKYAIEAWNRRGGRLTMAENKMEQVAALFNKKLGEEFSVEFVISRYIARSCFFTADGLFCEDRGPCETMLNSLLAGKAEIMGE